MINWIIGGAIAVLTVYIIARRIVRARKGRGNGSGCDGCSGGCSDRQCQYK